MLGPAQMTGRSIGSAHRHAEPDRPVGGRLHPAGAAGSALWDKVAEENFHQLLGIELDGVVYSAPIIQPTQSTFTSFDGKGEISGSLTQADAQSLAQAMNFGALPVELKAATSETVSATLGHSALWRASAPASPASSWCCSTFSLLPGARVSSSSPVWCSRR